MNIISYFHSEFIGSQISQYVVSMSNRNVLTFLDHIDTKYVAHIGLHQVGILTRYLCNGHLNFSLIHQSGRE